MIIIKDDTLTHVDSSLDILEHYGVKGMRWGKHRANMKKVRQEQKSRVKKPKSTMLANKRRGTKELGLKDFDTHARKRVKIEFVENNNERMLDEMHLNNVEMYNTQANIYNW